jgi:hypothetical protein
MSSRIVQGLATYLFSKRGMIGLQKSRVEISGLVFLPGSFTTSRCLLAIFGV